MKTSRYLVESDLGKGLMPERRKGLELVSQKTEIVGRWFNGEGGYGFIHPDE